MNEPVSSGGTASRRTRLKRLRDALRQRDWIGLTLEIVVVTLGVLLAFEIEQWAQERHRAAEERQFLERLYSDYGRAASEMRGVIGQHDRLMTAYRAAFQARNDTARPQEDSNSQDVSCQAGYLGTAPFSDTAFQELISSGKLDQIRNPQLRAKIRDLTTTQAWLRDRADAATEVTRDQGPFLIRHYQYRILANGTSTCRVLWAELFADPAAVTAAVRTYRMHERVRSGRQDLLRETERVRREIASALGRPERD